MGFFNQFGAIRQRRRKTLAPPFLTPTHPSALSSKTPPTSIQPSQSPPKTLAELERQMAIEAQVLPVAAPTAPQRSFSHWGKRSLGIGLALGIPIGLIAFVNLPYAPIRRPIAENAPLLLLPSYISLDHHVRQAFSNLEAAKQLIEAATTAEDLQLGAAKLKQAQVNLDRLPTWVWNELPDTQRWGWYSWSLSPLRLNQARAEAGRLESKLFQENNAQTLLSEAERTLGNASQQHQEAQTPIDQQAALRVWQDGLDQLQQIPPNTLAGRLAQQKLVATQRQLATLAGSTVQNQQSAALISAARAFGWQAAQASQNSPHTVEKWQQSLDLWQQAMDKLGQISVQTDPIGYEAAQKLKAEYQKNYGEIRMRQQLEAKAVQDFQQAQTEIGNLIRSSNGSTQMSQLQQIIQRLEAIDSGTTVYPESQKLLLSAQQKLQEWQR